MTIDSLLTYLCVFAAGGAVTFVVTHVAQIKTDIARAETSITAEISKLSLLVHGHGTAIVAQVAKITPAAPPAP